MPSAQAPRPLAASRMPRMPVACPAADRDSSPETEVWVRTVPWATHASCPHSPLTNLLQLLLPWQLCTPSRHPSDKGAPHIPQFPQCFQSFSPDTSCEHVVDDEGCVLLSCCWHFIIIVEQLLRVHYFSLHLWTSKTELDSLLQHPSLCWLLYCDGWLFCGQCLFQTVSALMTCVVVVKAIDQLVSN